MAKDCIYNDDERLQMMQSNIERMANNSANCKTWMVTVVAGLLALNCSMTALNGWILIAVLPVCMFWYLDGLYLSLERGMRNRERDFLNNISNEAAYHKALYDFTPLLQEKDDKGTGLVKTKGQWWTKSVLPFYVTMLSVIMIVFAILNWSEISCILFREHY